MTICEGCYESVCICDTGEALDALLALWPGYPERPVGIVSVEAIRALAAQGILPERLRVTVRPNGSIHVVRVAETTH